MKLYDVFCGAGGATKGYQRAGFRVIGIDNKPQKHYCGDGFIEMDALMFLDRYIILGDFEKADAFHASPPCQKYSVMTKGRWKDRLASHPDLIMAVRDMLLACNLPFTIENVAGAKHNLLNPILLCGTMFQLGTKEGNQLRRHRYFETSWLWSDLLPQCQHNKASTIGVYGGGQHPLRRKPATIGVWGHAGGSSNRDGLPQFGTDARCEAMGIDWMTGNELSEAIPPAYTEFIGKYLMREVMSK
jgi:DNA (cytosine-5)-methyltransferase 1